VTFIAAGARSLDRQQIGLGQRCGAPPPEDCLPAGLTVIGRRRCAAQLLPSDTDMT
jgi:anti-sigma factor RsiW